MKNYLTIRELLKNEQSLEEEISNFSWRWQKYLKNTSLSITYKFPIQYFEAEFKALTAYFLPEMYWPTILKKKKSFSSLKDFWSFLPAELQGHLNWELPEWIRIISFLASPTKMGTQADRYPEMYDIISPYLDQGFKLLDIGCGTGQGTCALFQKLSRQFHTFELTGRTLEALDVYWAQKQINYSYPKFEYPKVIPNYKQKLLFEQQDILDFDEKERWDLIICNGLLWGPAMNENKSKYVLNLMLNGLKENAYIYLENDFHEGFQYPNLNDLIFDFPIKVVLQKGGKAFIQKSKLPSI
ncbi:MAG: class I SAM-dependent methyltransferase [Lentisphaeria bacterium]|nr:class I SAM-dependent methyltransferase [Lentisphaeria bacterium]